MPVQEPIEPVPAAQRREWAHRGAGMIVVSAALVAGLRAQQLAPQLVPVAHAAQHVDDHGLAQARAPHRDRLAQAPLQVEQQRAAQRIAQQDRQQVQAQVERHPAPGIDGGLDQHGAAGGFTVRAEMARHRQMHPLANQGEVRGQPGRVRVEPTIEQHQLAQQGHRRRRADRREVAALVRARIEQHVGELAAPERQAEFGVRDGEFGEAVPQDQIERGDGGRPHRSVPA